MHTNTKLGYEMWQTIFLLVHCSCNVLCGKDLTTSDQRNVLDLIFFRFLDEELVDYPMGVRQSATILFPDCLEKKFNEKEQGAEILKFCANLEKSLIDCGHLICFLLQKKTWIQLTERMRNKRHLMISRIIWKLVRSSRCAWLSFKLMEFPRNTRISSHNSSNDRL